MVNGKSESVPRDQAFPFLDVYCLLLLGKSQLFHAIWIHENCFELFLPAIFLFEIFSTWISRLPFAVNVTLNLSIVKKLLTNIPVQKLKNWSSVPFLMEWKRCTHSACYLGIFLEIQDLSRCCLPQNHILQNQIVILHVNLCSLNQ